MAKRKRLNTQDIEAIANIIRQQELYAGGQNKPKETLMQFANTVACRNIREGILHYLEENIDLEEIPYEAFA